MANFTEGEWYATESGVWSSIDNMPWLLAERYNGHDGPAVSYEQSIDNFRLMAQSKKMYEVLNKIMDHFAHGGTMQSAPWIEARAILSGIDNE